eukprot:CAMPEP_0174267066 /NCGR_PEP_ID=MMETSP0439-20130205/32334_1 /TAXON_ID=0 /ORGANISM="Stereomyxa ramosa, Strain Chinc5" /LENGTH=84 /DNA_ID=CAMNT_0015354369 /DNA_START=219 /DNA_END=470 /DNA_ORIENTATION=+
MSSNTRRTSQFEGVAATKSTEFLELRTKLKELKWNMGGVGEVVSSSDKLPKNFCLPSQYFSAISLLSCLESEKVKKGGAPQKQE